MRLLLKRLLSRISVSACRITGTLILCGFPNVDKSSFINNVTRADVEVQPYAFATKARHLDYKVLRWQVIDTPGILDQPLEERNTIEMQAVTALAHLKAAVLFIMDISEQCNKTIAEQAKVVAVGWENELNIVTFVHGLI
ncbi:unnamed protein product [Cylicocyclus nassatus]|uniref:Nucleolar GTP-binding protein 1 Rossman-fold domain-containing protein n=1 Tax=Cylicocyclus nassatus TaxID=53992 RepID=A0AA36H511_CYLNA|nr:unnamed protein product [Cylicocyclus nassatus]